MNECDGERRITGGKNTTVPHTYMVYLRRAEKEAKNYSAWLCGGALIGPRMILTSAACVKDVNYIYVIAGYHKYTSEIVEKDECLAHTIRKIIHICVPKSYDLKYKEFTKWSAMDIAVVKANKRIVGDHNYVDFCDYAPTMIDINYDQEELQATGKDVLILGWGHKGIWRHGNDTNDYNQENLNYGATKIYNKTKCAEEYKKFDMEEPIKSYMICTLGAAPFDDQGEKTGKGNKISSIYTQDDGCSDEEDKVKVEEKSQDRTQNKKTKKINRVGICQNDHGGPLITWQRNKQVIIGVASLFKVKKEKCIGPYLFTSTYYTSDFLKCVVDEFSKYGRRSMPDYCRLPPEEKGFEIIERKITWRVASDELSHENMDYTDPLITEAPTDNLATEKWTEENIKYTNLMTPEVRAYQNGPSEGPKENTENTNMVTPEVRLYQNEPSEGLPEYETFRVRPQKPLRDVGYD
ncbi:unnamed protein product [Arctia plantaginis]|uniref:Peptidase S1 domain-containing protein n=1 Tax=Arctia plantaginis TaxID=874455 RepID=A0A8S1BN02_ARCPL|nr:unnamed protein product [Arctia plantaginis]